VLREIARTTAPAAAILIRLAVGAVSLAEEIPKFLFPGRRRHDRLGAAMTATVNLARRAIAG
jgi:hypothetical protein